MEIEMDSLLKYEELDNLEIQINCFKKITL